MFIRWPEGGVGGVEGGGRRGAKELAEGGGPA